MGIRVEACEAQLALALRGELGAPLSAARELEAHGSTLGRAWAGLLRSAAHGLDPRAAEAATPQLVTELGGANLETDRALARTCALHERRALGAFDVETLDAWRGVRPRGDDERLGAENALSDLRRAVLTGRPSEAAPHAEVARTAGALDAPELVVESVTLRGLTALGAGDSAEARSACRRASRIARTEGLLELEYLANLALARMRRHTGRAHAASAILSALSLVCSSPWRGWLAWELTFAGRPSAAERALDRAAEGPAERLARALVRSMTADGGAASGLLAEAPPMVERELHVLLACRDGLAGAHQDDATADFIRGVTDDVPRPLSGLVIPPKSTPTRSMIWVRWDSMRGARRVLATAAELARGATYGVELGAGEDRPAASLAALLLAGPEGCPVPTLYRAIFGGAYEAVAHDGLLRTTLYRARAALGARGEIERAEGVVTLRPTAPVAVPDPRCAMDAEARVLGVLASGDPMSAAELADELGLSVRKIQKSLRQLVDEGACQQVRAGRQIRYVVEDTTFSEPTIQRLRPPGAEDAG